MTEKQIVTLLVEEGKKPGQPIATYLSGRRRYLVFMPENTPVGKQVRVELVDTGKKDSRGEPLYRGVPSPVEYTERWKDNGDGTASRVKIATDWLGNESEAEVIETRLLATREGNPSSDWRWKFQWDVDLASTKLNRQTIKTIPLQKETVASNGILSWVETGKREELVKEETLPVIESSASGWWTDHRFELNYPPDDSVTVLLQYQDPNPENRNPHYPVQTHWGELPAWVQNQIQARYPICSCGRQRRDDQVPDGYGKCELCRAEETCERCGKKRVKIALVNGQKVCDNCKPYAEAEKEIETSLSAEKRQEFADLARLLRSGQALPQPAGEAVLKASLNHISSQYTKERLVAQWSGYPWYYFTDQGVYGSIFAPAALSLLEHLSEASGNGLVEMIAWFPDDHTSTPYLLYHVRTQVLGEKAHLPSFNHIILLMNDGRIRVADRLRGSEADRVAAVRAYRQAEEELASYDCSRISKLMSEAHQALQDEEQNYALVLEKVKAAYAEKARRQVLEDLLVREYATCPVCGEQVDWGSSHYCSQQEALRARGNYQNFQVKVSLVGETVLVEVVAEYNESYGEYELVLRTDDSIIPDPTLVETKTFWRQPTSRERELADQISNLRRQLEVIKHERQPRYGRVEITFHEGKNPRGEPQLQAEGIFTGSVENKRAEGGWSEYQDHQALFVCRTPCIWLDEQPEAGQTWLATVTFQIGVDKKGRPIIVVNPQVRSDREAKLQAEISRLEAELKAEQNRQANFVDKPFDNGGNPQTAMADALRKAGLIK